MALITELGQMQVYVAPAFLTGRAPGSASVSGTSAVVVAANINRRSVILVNLHATQWVYLAFGQAAELNKGVALAPNGGSYSMNALEVSSQTVNAIASGAATPVAIQEFEYAG